MSAHLAHFVVIQGSQPEGHVRDISPRIEVMEGEYGPRVPVVALQRLEPYIPAANLNTNLHSVFVISFAMKQQCSLLFEIACGPFSETSAFASLSLQPSLKVSCRHVRGG